MAVSSYGAATKTSGVVRILKDLDHDLEGQRRAAGRGHRGLRSHAEVPAEEPGGAQARRRSRSRRSCARTGIQKVPLDLRYVGFDIPQRVRRGLRARLRRAVSATCRTSRRCGPRRTAATERGGNLAPSRPSERHAPDRSPPSCLVLAHAAGAVGRPSQPSPGSTGRDARTAVSGGRPGRRVPTSLERHGPRHGGDGVDRDPRSTTGGSRSRSSPAPTGHRSR